MQEWLDSLSEEELAEVLDAGHDAYNWKVWQRQNS